MRVLPALKFMEQKVAARKNKSERKFSAYILGNLNNDEADAKDDAWL